MREKLIGDDEFRFYLTDKQRKTIEHLKRPPNRTERSKIGSYIRLFEGVVIVSLKKYVNSNETEFQAAVLDLLVELLLLRVNYSLLDADEVRSLVYFFFMIIISFFFEIAFPQSHRQSTRNDRRTHQWFSCFIEFHLSYCRISRDVIT